MSNISYTDASAVLAAALADATRAGVPSSVAVVDAGRNLIAFARQDGAILASIEIAPAKAFTACSLQLSTADLAGAVQPGAAFHGLSSGHHSPYIPFGGGRALIVDGVVVGAIGAAGGSPDQDDAVAAAGQAALTREKVTA